MNAIFADSDRSVERAVDLAISAGIAYERARVREILEISGPPARGIEQAKTIMALAGCSPEEVRSTVTIMSTNVSAEDLAQQRRADFQVVAGRSCEPTSAQKLES